MDLDGLDLDEQVRDLPLPFLRMLDLARALAFDPQLLLLDEITAALPPDLSDAGLRRDAAVEGAQPLGAVHLPPPGRGARALRHVHRAARRSRTWRRSCPARAARRRSWRRCSARRRTVVREEARVRGGDGDAIGDRPVLEAEHLGAGRLLDDVSLSVRARRGARSRRAGGPGAGRRCSTCSPATAGRPRRAASSTAPGRQAAPPVRRHPPGRGARPRRPPASPCCRSGRSARTSPPRCSTASASGGRSTGARSAAACSEAVDRLSIDTRGRQPGPPAVGRQPAEGHDRPLAGRAGCA